MTQPKTLADIFGELPPLGYLDVWAALPGLTGHELRDVIDAAQAILAGRAEDAVGAQRDETTSAPEASRGGGWLELKTINGCGPYVYRRWREGRRLRSEYVGKAREA